MTRVAVVPAFLLLGASCQPLGEQGEIEGSAQYSSPVSPAVEYLNGPERAASDLPFSEAVRVGHMLYLSGQIGTEPGGELVEGGIVAETRQTMDNIKATLERFGSSLDRVVKCTAMLADMSEWGAMNEVYVQYFPDHKPARSAFGTSGLALGAQIEIECWATLAE
jgi:reactive intermediate/imine deaminase